jgi:hypothetical protein
MRHGPPVSPHFPPARAVPTPRAAVPRNGAPLSLLFHLCTRSPASSLSSTSSSNLAPPLSAWPHPITFPCRSHHRWATGELQCHCRLRNRARLHRRPNTMSLMPPNVAKGDPDIILVLTTPPPHRRQCRYHGRARCSRWPAPLGQIWPEPPVQAKARQAVRPLAAGLRVENRPVAQIRFPHFPYFILTSEISSNFKNPWKHVEKSQKCKKNLIESSWGSLSRSLNLVINFTIFICIKIHECKPCLISTKLSKHYFELNTCMPLYTMIINLHKTFQHFSLSRIICTN